MPIYVWVILGVFIIDKFFKTFLSLKFVLFAFIIGSLFLVKIKSNNLILGLISSGFQILI